MLIHKDNVSWDTYWHVWALYLPDIGSKNEATIYFSSKENEIPETGDQVVNNVLVKAKRD